MPKAEVFKAEDLALKKAEDLFTDRDEPRHAFWELYNSIEQGEYIAIGYYGVGGIGKSTLLKKIGEEIDQKVLGGKGPLDHILFSFEGYATKEEFLFVLSRQMMLCNKGLIFPLFDEALTKIYKDTNKDIEKLQKDVVESFAKNPVVNIALSVVGDIVPGSGTATNLLERVASFASGKMTKHERESGKSAEIYKRIAHTDYKDLTRDLHEFFIYDAGEVMSKRTRPLVIMLDAYEKYVDILKDVEMSMGKDNWIHSVEKRLVNIPNTLWVVAGREKIEWKEDVLPPENLHKVGDLSVEDAKKYFEKAKVDDTLLAKYLCDLCKGTPVYMDMCVNTYHEVKKKKVPVESDFGKDTSDLARRYLDSMDKDTRRLLELISWLPDVWTKSMVIDTAKQVNYESYLPELNVILKLSLIEPVRNGYKLHQVCREAARKVCDNVEDIQRAIVVYAEKQLLDPETKEDKWQLLNSLFDILQYVDGVSLSEGEWDTILDILKEKRKYCADYYECEKLSQKIESYVKKTNPAARIKVRCINIRISDFNSLGRYVEAFKLANENYTYANEQLTEEDEETLAASLQLSNSYFYLKKYEEAMKLDERCYSIRKDVLGEKHPDTLISLNAYASSYAALGDTIKSNELYMQCYELRKEVLGAEHPDTLTSLSNLASSLKRKGEYQEARNRQEECYEIRKRVLGEEHPQTLDSLNYLANIYACFKEFEKAKENIEQCYMARKRVLGEEHPRTLSTLFDLAIRYSELKDYEEAKNTDEECYEIRKRVLGEEHPDTLSSLNNVAFRYKSLGQYEIARIKAEQCYEIKKRVLGEEHNGMTSTMYLLASIYEKIADPGLYQKAKELRAKAWEIKKKDRMASTQQPSNRLSDMSFKELLDLVKKQNSETAEQRYMRKRSELGEEHPETLTAMHNLAYDYNLRGEDTKARELTEQCCMMKERSLGESHPDLLPTLRLLERLYARARDLEKVIIVQDKIKVLEEKLKVQRLDSVENKSLRELLEMVKKNETI